MAAGQGDYTYDVGDVVEVIGSEYGLLGSFYEAIVEKKINKYHYEVKYFGLLEPKGRFPLTEKLPVGNLRPIPPHKRVMEYELGDEVDCELDVGNWHGEIIAYDRGENQYYVKFPLRNDKQWVYPRTMRPHFHWTGERFIGQEKFNYMLGY